MESTAKRLRKALEMRRMKQIDLANLTQIGKSSISTYLTGEYLPKQINLYKMAVALNVNEAWLMGLDVPMERQSVQRVESQKENPAQTDEAISAFESLTPENQEKVRSYVAFLLSQQSDA